MFVGTSLIVFNIKHLLSSTICVTNPIDASADELLLLCEREDDDQQQQPPCHIN
jgi:hypothetical protein